MAFVPEVIKSILIGLAWMVLTNCHRILLLRSIESLRSQLSGAKRQNRVATGTATKPYGKMHMHIILCSKIERDISLVCRVGEVALPLGIRMGRIFVGIEMPNFELQLSYVRELQATFGFCRKWEIATLMGIGSFLALLDVISVGMIFPIIAIIVDPSARILRYEYKFRNSDKNYNLSFNGHISGKIFG